MPREPSAHAEPVCRFCPPLCQRRVLGPSTQRFQEPLFARMHGGRPHPVSANGSSSPECALVYRPFFADIDARIFSRFEPLEEIPVICEAADQVVDEPAALVTSGADAEQKDVRHSDSPEKSVCLFYPSS